LIEADSSSEVSIEGKPRGKIRTIPYYYFQ
jgi:hypothetical protein